MTSHKRHDVTNHRPLFVQQLLPADITEKIKALHHWVRLWRESTGDQWFPLTKGPVMRITSPCHDVIMISMYKTDQSVPNRDETPPSMNSVLGYTKLSLYASSNCVISIFPPEILAVFMSRVEVTRPCKPEGLIFHPCMVTPMVEIQLSCWVIPFVWVYMLETSELKNTWNANMVLAYHIFACVIT